MTLVRYPGGSLSFGQRTYVMGILNVTPDSFSDGGDWIDPDRAVRRARAMIREGADLVDVGGESTRPGAKPVSSEEEIRRVVPVIARLARERILVSIDSSKAAVAEAAIRAGAKILNDVTALRGDPAMGRLAAHAKVPVILMHMKGSPRTMQQNPKYRDVVEEILGFFREILRIALRVGISRDKIILDPGIGFGKSPKHNLEILRRLDEFRSLGRPLAIGTSRKSFIGRALGRRVDDRVSGTAATVAGAILRGADVVRVHDVREMSDVVRMTDLLR
jgi:dihydropteroate synthase